MNTIAQHQHYKTVFTLY